MIIINGDFLCRNLTGMERFAFERYFWCLTIFNNWWLGKKSIPIYIQKSILKIIKSLLLFF